MGAAYSQSISPRHFLMEHLWKEDIPYSFDPNKYDPYFGFENREQKVCLASEKEMDSANLELEHRDFCAHIRLQCRGCINYNRPFRYRCRGLFEELRDCYAQERLDDMKEFERERRLNIRERRIMNKRESMSE